MFANLAHDWLEPQKKTKHMADISPTLKRIYLDFDLRLISGCSVHAPLSAALGFVLTLSMSPGPRPEETAAAAMFHSSHTVG